MKEAKDKEGRLPFNQNWNGLKESRMGDILEAKFLQNKTLRDKLPSTGNVYLIEASTDMKWGCDRRLHSKEITEGNWNGLNKLGELLMAVGGYLRRKGY